VAFFAPPFGSTLTSDSEEICAERSPLSHESVRPLPYAREYLLHDIFRGLAAYKELPQKCLHTRRVLTIKTVERDCVTAPDMFP
jgi:hypothetical protein